MSSSIIPFLPFKRPRLGAVLRAGRLTRPDGKLTLTMNGNAEGRNDVLRYIQAAHAAWIYATLGACLVIDDHHARRPWW